MCNTARRYLEDRQAARRDRRASLASVRDVPRTNCKPECRAADARNFSIRPCCPAFGREIRAADRRMRGAEINRRSIARGFSMHARGLPKPTPDEAARRSWRRGVPLAKDRGDDRVRFELASLIYRTVFRLTKIKIIPIAVITAQISANHSP